MAHEIGKDDKFAGVGVQSTKRAWHGLGEEIPENLNAVTAFQEVGIDWGTYLAPIEATLEDGTKVAIPGMNAHIRADNRENLGLVTDGYKPFENMDLARLADSLVDEGHEVSVETCGSLYNGRRVYVLVKLPRTIQATRDDVLEQFICVSNGHGGFAKLSAYPTSVRVVCANTLRWSESSIASGVSFRHSGDFDSKVKQARVVLGLAGKENEMFEAQVQKLVKTQLNDKRIKAFMQRTYEVCFGKIDPEGDAVTVEKLIATRDKVLEKWYANLEDERQRVKGIEGSAWAAYNAISQYHDHERGRYKSVKESDARVHSNLFGVSQKHKLAAFRGALALK